MKHRAFLVLALAALFLLAGCAAGSGESMTSFTLMVVLITFGATMAGGAVPILCRIDSNRMFLELATCISAGLLLSAAFAIAIPEGFGQLAGGGHAHQDHEEHEEHEEPDGGHPPEEDGEEEEDSHQAEKHVKWGGLAILAGFLVMFLAESLGFGHDIHEEHHGEAGGHLHHPSPAMGKNTVLVLVAGLTLHSVADGMAIGAGAASGSISLTLSLFVSIVAHKIPAAFSLVVFSQHAHGNTFPTWRNLVIFSLSTPLAILATWAILDGLTHLHLGLVLLFSAGTFIYVSTIDVLPNVLKAGRRKQTALLLILGGALMLAIDLLLAFLGFSHGH